MTRKSFLSLFIKIILAGIGVMALFLLDFSSIRRIYYKFDGILKPQKNLQPDSERAPYNFPENGYLTSVEMALNSRCTSDYNGNPKKFHWGMFDPDKKLTQSQAQEIIRLSKVPRFTDHRLETQTNNNLITFIIDNKVEGIERDWLMIESGMQQQATGLVCAALGAGMVFKNMGQDGTKLSEADHANVKIKVDAMKPTYDHSYWSSSPPVKSKPWTHGNLPDPIRNDEKPLIKVMDALETKNKGSKISSAATISQLLWAARGRTPHLYKSTEWGMTIPTWGGEQHISGVYFLLNRKLYKFLNWHNNRPTQRIELANDISENQSNDILSHISAGNCFIVLARNEAKARSFWEIGYQLFNMMLQAHSLNISYEAILLNEDQKELFNKIGLSKAVAVMALPYTQDEQLAFT